MKKKENAGQDAARAAFRLADMLRALSTLGIAGEPCIVVERTMTFLHRRFRVSVSWSASGGGFTAWDGITKERTRFSRHDAGEGPGAMRNVFIVTARAAMDEVAEKSRTDIPKEELEAMKRDALKKAGIEDPVYLVPTTPVFISLREEEGWKR